jgi:hypothetical protein
VSYRGEVLALDPASPVYKDALSGIVSHLCNEVTAGLLNDLDLLEPFMEYTINQMMTFPQKLLRKRLLSGRGQAVS